jgi:hypothetical protein
MQMKVDRELTFEEQWQATRTQVQIPDSMRELFFEKCGNLPLSQINNRQYIRYYLRVKAIVDHRDDKIGCYTMDLSRQGIGLLSPIELERSERVQLHLPQRGGFLLEITRCCQLEDQCFECGGRFVL